VHYSYDRRKLARTIDTQYVTMDRPMGAGGILHVYGHDFADGEIDGTDWTKDESLVTSYRASIGKGLLAASNPDYNYIYRIRKP
jgi:hypothetical protein